MPIPSPFDPRTRPLCSSFRFKDWAGFLAVSSYEVSHEREYFAFREGSGLLDASPLYKYEIRGADAGAFLSRVLTRDVRRLKPGRLTYTCWCNDAGKVVDDGTVARLADDRYRLTAADPAYRWLLRLARGYAVEIADVSRDLAALALQGPTSRALLGDATGGDDAVTGLRFFRLAASEIAGRRVEISRTGYTGDLGYELWIDAGDALAVWDALVAAGGRHGLLPVGLDALDMTRIEAGFVLHGVDYHGACQVVQEWRKSTPYELSLDWTVELDREPFVGRDALAGEAARGPRWRLVGLEADWRAIEALYERQGLPPALPLGASREALPVYASNPDAGGEPVQVGRATSHVWSPILKKLIALATVEARHAGAGTRLELEHTVEFARERVPVSVVPTPFFDPPRKRARPGG